MLQGRRGRSHRCLRLSSGLRDPAASRSLFPKTLNFRCRGDLTREDVAALGAAGPGFEGRDRARLDRRRNLRRGLLGSDTPADPAPVRAAITCHGVTPGYTDGFNEDAAVRSQTCTFGFSAHL